MDGWIDGLVTLFVIFILHRNNVINIFAKGSMIVDVQNQCNGVLIMMNEQVNEMER